MARKVNSDSPERYGLGLAVGTVSRLREMLRGAFNFAVDEKLIEQNPVKRTKLPPPPLSSANPLTFHEALAFIKVKDCSWYGDAFVFNLHTGLRPGELMGLVWDDVDFIAGTLRIERACKSIQGEDFEIGPPKSLRSARIIELAPEHLEFLKERKRKIERFMEEKKREGQWLGEPAIQEWLQKERANQLHLYKDINLIFPSRHGNVPHINAPRMSFKYMLRRAGFTGNRLKIRWYDLRHTHATFLLILGFPDHEVAARMGHTVDILNKFYAHMLPERQRTASSIFVSLFPVKPVESLDRNHLKSHIRQFINKTNLDLELTLLSLIDKK